MEDRIGNCLLDCKALTKVYSGTTVVDKASFSVQGGEVFGLLGPNGAGKTTTIRMLVGLIGMTSGDAYVFGHSIRTKREAALKNVGAIVEQPHFYNFLTGRENLKQFARMHNVSNEKINEVISTVELSDAIDQRVKTYSLGMRQRLGLAQSLLHDPSVLLLDEPTNGLDPKGIRQMRDLLRRLAAERGLAIVVSSHLLSEMELMCDRFAVMKKGNIVAIESVHTTESEIVVSFTVDKVDETVHTAQTLGIQHHSTDEKKVRFTMPSDTVPKVVQHFVESGIAISAVVPERKTLEDRFIEMTEGGEQK